MLKLRSILLIALAILVAGSSAQAAIVFTAVMTDAKDGASPTTVGGVPRTSFGFATFTLNDAMTAMTFTATVTGIDIKPNGIPQSADTNDVLTAAHIHAGPTPAPTLRSMTTTPTTGDHAIFKRRRLYDQRQMGRAGRH